MNEPDVSSFAGRIDSSFGQTEGSDGENFSVHGMINLPLSDDLALRVSGGLIDNAGIVDYVNVYETDANGVPTAAGGDVAHGGPVYSNNRDADTVEIDYVRAGLKWTPIDVFENEICKHGRIADIGGYGGV